MLLPIEIHQLLELLVYQDKITADDIKLAQEIIEEYPDSDDWIYAIANGNPDSENLIKEVTEVFITDMRSK